MDSIRVLIVDDEALVRHALRIFVDTGPDMTVVGEAADGAGAVAAVEALRPNVVLMDLQMPQMNGIEATKQITGMSSGTHVLAVTTFSSERHVVPALRAGASGYLVKDTEPEDLLAAIREINAGRAVMSPGVTRDLIQSLRDDPIRRDHSAPLPDALTARELTLVRLIARGMSNAEIARTVHLAEPTVKAALSRIMAKWSVRDRVQLLIYALSNRIVEIDAVVND